MKVCLIFATVVFYCSHQCSKADDSSEADSFTRAVLNVDGPELVTAALGGVVLFDYPDIQQEVQKVSSVERAKDLALSMLKMDVDSDHRRRRVYFAIHALALKIHSRKPNDLTVGYILGFIDERMRHEPENLARTELLRASNSIRRETGFGAIKGVKNQ